MKLILPLIVLLASLAWSGLILAAQSEPRTLEKVVITAGRIEEKAASVTQVVTVIPGEEIRKNQYQDLGHLLQNYGLQLTAYSDSGSFSQLAIRGLGSREMGNELKSQILILVDGRRSGTGIISLIPQVNIERIEILRGPAAMQYGSSAMGGVVNIITRRGSETVKASVEAGAGSFDTFRVQGEAAGKIGGLDYSIGASVINMDDYKVADSKRYENTGLDEKIAYSANAGYSFLDEHRIGVSSVGVIANHMGSPGDISSISPTAYTDRYNFSFDGIYEGGVKSTDLRWVGRYYYGRNHYLNDDPNDAWAYYKAKTDYQGAQGQLSFDKGFLGLTAGLDWDRYEAWNSAYKDSTYKNIGYFVMGKLIFFEERIILSGGLRYDDYELELPGRSNVFDNTTSSVGLAVKPFAWLTMRANYGESFLIPSAQELLGFADPWGGPDYIGNPDLDPEKGKGWDAGFEADGGFAKLSVAYFQNSYKDKITTRMVGANKQYYNLGGSAKYRGIEAQAEFDVGDLLDWNFALRPYVNLTRMFKREDSEGNDIKYVNEIDMAYGIAFSHPGAGLDVDLRLIYMGEQKIDYWDPVAFTSSLDRIGGRTTADLYITQTILKSEQAGTFSIKLELKNIFDKYYYTIKDYPLPGRSLWLGLRWDY